MQKEGKQLHNYELWTRRGTIGYRLVHLLTHIASYTYINYKTWCPSNYWGQTSTIHNILIMLKIK